MKSLSYTFAAVFLVTFLATPTMGAGWFWDIGNGFGFAAFAGLVYLGVTSYRRLDVRAHQLFGYATLFLALVHVFWFLLGDPAAVEFIKLGAPDYMWLGIVGLVLLFVLMICAQIPDRLRIHKDYGGFRYWHRVLAVATIGCCTYHVVVSQFYLHTWYQSALLVAIAIAASFGRDYWIKLGTIKTVTPATYLGMAALLSGLFSAIRNWPA